MSLMLGEQTGERFSATTTLFDNQIIIAGKRMSMDDFRNFVVYVLCNAPIEDPEDPRFELLEDIRSLYKEQHGAKIRLRGERPLPKHFYW